MQDSESLKELDVSWSIVANSQWFEFLEVLSFNRQLTSLTLAFNTILEEQNYLVKRELAEREWETTRSSTPVDELLTERNQEVMDFFKDFVKYNPNLIHLDLRRCGLTKPAIMIFGYYLTRA